VPHVDDRHRRFGLHRGVVDREDVGAGEREQRRDAVRPGDVEGVDAAVNSRGCGVFGRGGLFLFGLRHARKLLDRLRPGGWPVEPRALGPDLVEHREQ
jgi:hypothetical protein